MKCDICEEELPDDTEISICARCIYNIYGPIKKEDTDEKDDYHASYN